MPGSAGLDAASPELAVAGAAGYEEGLGVGYNKNIGMS